MRTLALLPIVLALMLSISLGSSGTGCAGGPSNDQIRQIVSLGALVYFDVTQLQADGGASPENMRALIEDLEQLAGVVFPEHAPMIAEILGRIRAAFDAGVAVAAIIDGNAADIREALRALGQPSPPPPPPPPGN